MVIVILLIIAIPAYLFAISCANQIPQDQAEADLYARGLSPDWRNIGM